MIMTLPIGNSCGANRRFLVSFEARLRRDSPMKLCTVEVNCHTRPDADASLSRRVLELQWNVELGGLDSLTQLRLGAYLMLRLYQHRHDIRCTCQMYDIWRSLFYEDPSEHSARITIYSEAIQTLAEGNFRLLTTCHDPGKCDALIQYSALQHNLCSLFFPSIYGRRCAAYKHALFRII